MPAATASPPAARPSGKPACQHSGRLVLGIETSCDETAASVVRADAASEAPGMILSDIVASQIEAHAPFGGVVPELAARAHVEKLDHLIKAALDEAGVTLAEVDAIAATAGPGLIGGVIVGLVTAKALALAANKPLIAINHLEGHALTARLTHGLAFPYLLLLVSGGHTQLLAIEGVGRYRRYGSTIDDALGEAFDKTAKLLDLGFPGGPAVDRVAATGDASRFALPRPLKGRPGCDFSLAGLKTAFRLEAERAAPLDDEAVADLCAGFQAAVADIIADRVGHALARFEAEHGRKGPLVVAGGVAANSAVRKSLADLAQIQGFELIIPDPKLCTDNAAMIAWAGLERLRAGLASADEAIARPRWPLDQDAEPVYGSGRKGAKA